MKIKYKIYAQKPLFLKRYFKSTRVFVPIFRNTLCPRRGKCEHCDGNPTTNQRLDWYEFKSNYTKAYEKNILLSLVNSTVSDVSIKEEVGYGAVCGILDRHISENPNWKAINKIGLLGLDEIAIKKGYKDFMTIITAREDEKIKVIAVLKGREKATVKGFLQGMPKRLRRTIIGVCCDMYDGYINAAYEVFGKKIPVIADRFHVTNLYRRSLVKLRKKELSRLRKELSEKEYKDLKPGILILIRNKEYVTQEEKRILNKVFKHSPILKVAYNLCCKFTGIYNSKIGKKAASNKIEGWILKVEKKRVKMF